MIKSLAADGCPGGLLRSSFTFKRSQSESGLASEGGEEPALAGGKAGPRRADAGCALSQHR